MRSCVELRHGRYQTTQTPQTDEAFPLHQQHHRCWGSLMIRLNSLFFRVCRSLSLMNEAHFPQLDFAVDWRRRRSPSRLPAPFFLKLLMMMIGGGASCRRRRRRCCCSRLETAVKGGYNKAATRQQSQAAAAGARKCGSISENETLINFC